MGVGTRLLGLEHGDEVWGGRVERDWTGLGGWALELRLKGFLTKNSDPKP